MDFRSEYIEDLKNNVAGYGVSFLRAYIDNKSFSPAHSYHLHYLFTYAKDTDRLNVICLDNLSNIVISNYLKTENKDKFVDDAMFEISKDFIENIYTGLKTNSLNKDSIFCRADQPLWDKFNEIKESFFIESMKDLKLSEYSYENKEIPFPDFKYQYATEDKYINIGGMAA